MEKRIEIACRNAITENVGVIGINREWYWEIWALGEHFVISMEPYGGKGAGYGYGDCLETVKREKCFLPSVRQCALMTFFLDDMNKAHKRVKGEDMPCGPDLRTWTGRRDDGWEFPNGYVYDFSTGMLFLPSEGSEYGIHVVMLIPDEKEL